MKDKNDVEFDPAVHKSKKDGTPMKLRGVFVVDDDKLRAAQEVISKVDEATSEFQLEDIPQSIIDQAASVGILLSVEDHMFLGSKGRHKRYFSFLHADSDNTRSFNRFVSEAVGYKGDLGKAESDSGF